MQKNAIAERITDALMAMQAGRFESSLLNMFPAMDATAQKRYKGQRPGDRFKKFIQDQEDIIHNVAISTNLHGNIYDGKTFAEVLYKLARNPVTHEAELSEKITFTDGKEISAGTEKWILPKSYILGFAIATIVATENEGLKGLEKAKFRLFEREFTGEELWGKQIMLREFIESLNLGGFVGNTIITEPGSTATYFTSQEEKS